eukprot:scaffold76088_cov47-Phaeocystis_antarctica.AAC.2
MQAQVRAAIEEAQQSKKKMVSCSSSSSSSSGSSGSSGATDQEKNGATVQEEDGEILTNPDLGPGPNPNPNQLKPNEPKPTHPHPDHPNQVTSSMRGFKDQTVLGNRLQAAQVHSTRSLVSIGVLCNTGGAGR